LYTGALPAPTLAFINANVQRFLGTPSGQNSLEHNYTPTGDADRLVQREVAGYAGGYGHCTFTPQELTQAFFDLVVWGEFGVKPTP
jgi:hypothetical protein